MRGADNDLAELSHHLQGDFRICHEAEGWELTAETFETLIDAGDVYRSAATIVDNLRGLARSRLNSVTPIELANVRERRGDGTSTVVSRVGVGAALAAGSGAAHGPTVATGAVPPASSWDADLELALRDHDVKAALEFLSLEPTWQSLYSALDLPRHDPRTNGERGVIARGEPAHGLAQLEGTVDNQKTLGTDARHGYARKAHPNPMSLDEAKLLVRRVIDAWIAELLQQGR